MLHLGYGKSYEKFPSIPVCHISSNFPALFHYAQVMNRQILKHGFTQLRRTAHILHLRQNLHQTCFNDFSNVKWCMKQTSV